MTLIGRPNPHQSLPPIKNPPPNPSANSHAIEDAIRHCANARVLMNRAAHTIGTQQRLGIRAADIGATITYLIADMKQAITFETIVREETEEETSNAQTEPTANLEQRTPDYRKQGD